MHTKEDYEEDSVSDDKMDLLEKHQFFKSDFEKVHSVQIENRKQCLQDRRFAFIAGSQWEDDFEQFVNKPKFEINKVKLSTDRIKNEYRNNRITVDFVSKDGSSASDLSEFCDGLYRANEYDSNAVEAYDNAFDEAVHGGIGAWRYTTKYVDDYDEDNEQQEICIEPIYDADIRVFFDIGSMRQDKSDAKRCYVIESYDRDQFEEEWGIIPNSIESEVDTRNFDWFKPDTVSVLEVYEIEESYEIYYRYKTVDGKEFKLTEEEQKDRKAYLKATGAKFIKKRKTKTRKVHKYIMDGSIILEDCGYIVGDRIPITMMFGGRSVVEGIERCHGHVRFAKDAQRLKNMQISNLAEMTSLGSFEKPIFLPEQIMRHDAMWASDNIDNNPYLMVDPVMDANGNPMPAAPLDYKRPPQIPPALAALLQQTETDIQEILGQQQYGEQVTGNVSTETAMLVQNRIDMNTFMYMSQFSKAMENGGRIWLGQAREIYTEKGRRVKVIDKKDKAGFKVIGNPKMDEHGNVFSEYDLKRLHMDVKSSVGPSSTTAKQGVIKNMTNMLQYAVDPETQQILTSAILMNMEGEGIEDISDYFRMKLVRAGAVKATEEEKKKLAEEAQNAQTPAEQEYLKAEAEKARAEAVESQADVILKQAQADQVRAKTAEILSNTDASKQKQALEAMRELGPRVNPPTVRGSPIL